MDAWLDAFLTLDRFSLDAVKICTRSFRRITDERLTDVCLRCLESVDFSLLYAHAGAVTNSATLCSGTGCVHIKEPDLELFISKLKGALLPSTINYVTVNARNNWNIGPAGGMFNDIWRQIQVGSLSLDLTANDDPQKCYDFILSASPQSCGLAFAREKDDETQPYYLAKSLAPSQFFTDQRLRECIAHEITDLSFEEAVPADAERFPLSNDGIVDFLFGNPELKRQRALTGGSTSASPNIFKRLVQAHLESEILEDISLDLDINSFDVDNEMDTAGFEENLLDYGERAYTRCDSSVQYEFPGEIRLQIVLLRKKLLMRRGKRRGWNWMAREDREKWLEDDEKRGDFDDWPAHEDVDDDEDGFFIGHSDYTD